MKMIVALLPKDTSRLPGIGAALPTPSIHHLPMDCPRCGEPCWVGPSQAESLARRTSQGWCYYCLLAAAAAGDRDITSAMNNVVSLNPGIDDEPRMP